MKTLLRLVVATLMFLTTTAYAEDLFSNNKPIPFEFGRPLAASDTIGGYPIWQGDGKWQLMHLEVNTTASRRGPGALEPNLIPIPLGRLYLIQAEQRKLVSSMEVIANLAQAWTEYWSGEPCKSEDFLWKKALSDHFADLNCVSLSHVTGFQFYPLFKPYLTKLRQENIDLPPTVLAITVSRYGTNGRLLFVQVIVNPEPYGFQRETGQVWAANPWHKEFASKDPKKKEFIDQLAKWAEAFAVRVGGPAFGKDAQAFSGLPSYHVSFQR
jgi:hypothetical protein